MKSPNPKPLSFENTNKALKIYDSTQLERDLLWEKAHNDKTIKTAQAADEKMRVFVCKAFYEDTKHINSLDKCLLLDVGPAIPFPGQELSFIRRMASKDY